MCIAESYVVVQTQWVLVTAEVGRGTVWCCLFTVVYYLAQRFVEFLQDALLVEHLALVAVLVVVVDLLAEVGGQLVEGHVLLHLFVLRGQR